jgi:membrane protein implicated in regulation of membrane protease activity
VKVRLPYDPGAKPLPRRPFRDSAIFYGVLAVIIVVVSAATGGGVARGVVAAVLFFLLALAWSWWRFRERLEREREGRRGPR